MVHVIQNRVFPSNTYLVNSGDSADCLLIDPGLDKEAIDEQIQSKKLLPKYILATHGHFDHTGSVSFFQKKYGAKFFIHEKDLRTLKAINFFIKIMKIDMKVDTPVPDYIIKGQEEQLEVGSFSIHAYNLPGHTEGSCVFECGDFLFTGDIIYVNGTGTNQFPGQDTNKLKETLRTIFKKFPDDTLIYPGHGIKGTLGEIRRNNTELNNFLID